MEPASMGMAPPAVEAMVTSKPAALKAQYGSANCNKQKTNMKLLEMKQMVSRKKKRIVKMGLRVDRDIKKIELTSAIHTPEIS